MKLSEIGTFLDHSTAISWKAWNIPNWHYFMTFWQQTAVQISDFPAICCPIFTNCANFWQFPFPAIWLSHFLANFDNYNIFSLMAQPLIYIYTNLDWNNKGGGAVSNNPTFQMLLTASEGAVRGGQSIVFLSIRLLLTAPRGQLEGGSQ